MQLCNSSLHTHGKRREVLNYWGVTRLDGSRGKKQVWRPVFEPEVFRKQMYCTEVLYLWHY